VVHLDSAFSVDSLARMDGVGIEPVRHIPTCVLCDGLAKRVSLSCDEEGAEVKDATVEGEPAVFDARVRLEVFGQVIPPVERMFLLLLGLLFLFLLRGTHAND